ncbi:NAD-dependent epimerase/dehydratase family protein [Dokdonia sp. Hel_I_53]|uniref:NAD-dependent epimerase/dehydratase family protein n=1 Tax=Dokdonia sp. Hel_I_53 TaxID=1566287 RepID=UPI0011997AB8|nr:NAD-dependent epimerase/dehydratase family protein [Dokdonia sp. Hel_I_53]TVZ52926.1 nucleoside-diphosphate-sugar epimerase [Dokdonia sp. Hel_I_53]
MILVTGSTGLVGRHLILALIQNKQEVRALYRSEDRKNEVERFYAFAKAESLIQFIDWKQGDINNIPRLEEVFSGVTHVYHCAAAISFDPYQFKNLTKVNIEGTANVVNLCLNYKVKKLIHLSSIATLAKTPNNPIDESNHWDPNARVSVYALTKYGAEMEVWRGTEEGLDAIIFNPGIILGEGDYNSGSGVLFKRVWDEKKYYIKGATATIDVKDLVNLMISGMQSSIKQERFIAISNNISYKKLLIAIAKSLDKKPPRIPLNKWILKITVFLDFVVGLFIRSRKITRVGIISLQHTTKYSNTKIKKEFSITLTPIDQTLVRIAKHFKRNHA